MPASALKVIQFGQESTWGTVVAATAKLMGLKDATLSVKDKIVHVEEKGTMAPSQHVVRTTNEGAASIEAVATYEDILFFLNGIFGAATPSGTGPYTWSYAAPTTTAVTPDFFSVEFGTTNAEYVMNGGMFKTLKISLAADDLWQVNADLIGKAIDTVTLASLSDRTVETINASNSSLYIDDWTGTIGTTTVGATLIDAELDVDTNRHMKHFVHSIGPTGYGDDQWSGILKTTLEFNATAKAYFDDHLSTGDPTQKQIRLYKASGTKSITVDFAGTLVDNIDIFDDRDGNMTVALTWEGTYNPTLGNWLKVEVINNVSSLP